MSTPDQIAVAQLWGRAQRCVSKRIPVGEAVAALREITVRPDLLAQTAGVMLGAWDGPPPLLQWTIDAARLLVMAGADRAQLPRWIRQGRENIEHSAGWAKGSGLPDNLDELLAELLDGIDL